ncbi:hypothetical protein CDD81_4718 [Ophiocordyceps australis]|uniref:Uncharacterized protein n=1 Tax=Ophiocordyceps australis TaxID=1399860 RepID=A0A2C5YBW0_9HYPO|nr:hypothetical protein CDD81_4718 [Ophiocordyceps australis]
MHLPPSSAVYKLFTPNTTPLHLKNFIMAKGPQTFELATLAPVKGERPLPPRKPSLFDQVRSKDGPNPPASKPSKEDYPNLEVKKTQ